MVRQIAYAFTLLLVCFPTLSSGETLRLAVGDTFAPNVAQGLEAIYIDLFSSIGYSIQFIPLPLKRSEKMLLSGGDLDGESVRIPSFADRVPNLVMVKEPSAVSEFVAYSADSAIQVDTVEALISGNYSIAYPAGNVMLLSLFEQSAQALELTEVWSTHQGLALAESKRVDLFLDVTSNVEHELKMTKRFESTLFHVGTPVKASFHIFLRKEFEALAEQLSEGLRVMKESGDYQGYISKYDIKIL